MPGPAGAGKPTGAGAAADWNRAPLRLLSVRGPHTPDARNDARYVTLSKPFMPPAAWPGTVQRYS